MEDIRGLLLRMASLTPRLFVMGGFAEDALLYSRIREESRDLDVLVPKSQVPLSFEQLQGMGLMHQALNSQDEPGPWLFTGAPGIPPVEVWMCEPEGHGYRFAVYGSAPDERSAIRLPEDCFGYPAVYMEGLKIQTVSPLTLCHLRAVSAVTRHCHLPESRAKDMAVVEKLRGQFLSDIPEGALAPYFLPD